MARAIHSPQAGEKITIRLGTADQSIQFDEVIRSAVPERSGNDLTFSFDNGGGDNTHRLFCFSNK